MRLKRNKAVWISEAILDAQAEAYPSPFMAYEDWLKIARVEAILEEPGGAKTRKRRRV